MFSLPIFFEAVHSPLNPLNKCMSLVLRDGMDG